MGQFNMISFCSKIPGRILPKLNTKLEMRFYTTHKWVSDQLKDLVRGIILDKSKSNSTGFSEDYNKRNMSSNRSVHVEIPESIICWGLCPKIQFIGMT